ncbi:MAG: Rieske 2Fe-2S domain-containing protein [Pseudomonadota bacterium]|nr:Rieske 2Fe-2S domain-containing protein [Pseudomonadota bacterium]
MHIPAEGEDGLFRQSWYPIALSRDVPAGEIVGKPFLDGRVVVYRAPDGSPIVMSAYCPHLGADLALGKIVDGNVQCAFHHWEYNTDGQCVKTGIGDPAPKSACLFKFPTQEKLGIIWAFNGTEPLFDLPVFEYDEDEVAFEAYELSPPFNCDPWVFAANTPDMQHLKAVHKVQFTVDDPHELVEWNKYGLKYPLEGIHQEGVRIKWELGLHGSSVFYRQGLYDDIWSGAIVGFGLPEPGKHIVFGAYMCRKGPEQEEQLARLAQVTKRTIEEDRELLNTTHYRHGVFTAADKTLARYLAILRTFPRAHPSAEFLN